MIALGIPSVATGAADTTTTDELLSAVVTHGPEDLRGDTLDEEEDDDITMTIY